MFNKMLPETRNSTSTASENIGGMAYLFNNLPVYLPYSLVSIVSIILGIAGNSCVIASVLISKKLRRNQTCILIVNLALSDLAISIFVHPSIVTGVFLGKHFFDRYMLICVFLAAICLVSCSTSLITMGFLAINRYMCIFNIKKYRKHFSIRNSVILCLLAWVLGILVDLPNFLGVGDHVYDLKLLTCHFDRLRAPYAVTFALFCIIIPCIGIGILYSKIFIYSSRIRGKLKDKRLFKKYGSTFKAVKIAKSLFASFMLFAVCWIPVAIVYIIGVDDQLPNWTHVMVNLAAHTNSSLNPLLYLVYNPIIREAYLNLIRRIISSNRLFTRKKKHSPPLIIEQNVGLKNMISAS